MATPVEAGREWIDSGFRASDSPTAHAVSRSAPRRPFPPPSPGGPAGTPAWRQASARRSGRRSAPKAGIFRRDLREPGSGCLAGAGARRATARTRCSSARLAPRGLVAKHRGHGLRQALRAKLDGKRPMPGRHRGRGRPCTRCTCRISSGRDKARGMRDDGLQLGQRRLGRGKPASADRRPARAMAFRRFRDDRLRVGTAPPRRIGDRRPRSGNAVPPTTRRNTAASAGRRQTHSQRHRAGRPPAATQPDPVRAPRPSPPPPWTSSPATSTARSPATLRARGQFCCATT